MPAVLDKLTTEEVEREAYWDYAQAPKHGRDQEHWYRAEYRLWKRWAREKLRRPYLAVEAAANPADVARSLEAIQRKHGMPDQGTFALLATLDGAPEFSRHCFCRSRHATNGVLPETQAELKDSSFYRLCYYALSLYGGQVLDKVALGRSKAVSVESRVYQDGCAAVFAGEKGLASVFMAALHLHRGLADLNEKQNLAWPERFHARLAVANSWSGAIRCLPLAWRAETVVAPEIFLQLERSHQELLLAAGVRIGPPA